MPAVAPLSQTKPLNLWQGVDASVAEKILESEDVPLIISLMAAHE